MNHFRLLRPVVRHFAATAPWLGAVVLVATGCLQTKLETGTPMPLPSASPTPVLTTDEQSVTYSIAIPSTSLNASVPLAIPQYSGAYVLDKAVLTITLTPTYTSSCESATQSDSNTSLATINVGVAGQGGLADLVDNSAQALSGHASAAAGQAAVVSPTFQAYTYSVELDNPTDETELAALTGSGQATMNVFAQLDASVTCGPGSSSDSGTVSGSASVTYTYSGLPVSTIDPEGNRQLAYNAAIPPAYGLDNTPLALPQYPGEKQLEKAVITVTLTPVISNYCLSQNNASSASISNGTLSFTLAGEGGISGLSATSATQDFSGSATASGPGQKATVTPTLSSYTYTVEYDYPADATMLAALSGNGTATIDMSETVNEGMSCSGGDVTMSESSQASGSASVVYTYPQ